MGGARGLSGKKTEPGAAIMDLTGSGAHVSVDALGVSATCRNSIMSLRKQGRHLQIGLTTSAEQGEIPVPIDRIVTMELQMIGSLGMQASHYPAMLQMVVAKKVTPKAMAPGTCALDGLNKIFKKMTRSQ